MSTQTIYNGLRAGGLTPAGALGLMGNWVCESACEACRLQGDFSAGRTASREYADRVDNGVMNEKVYAGDAKGWGLAQWTWHTRKSNLLTFCRQRSVSIANEEAQTDFALWELREYYPQLWQYLCSCRPDQLHEAVERVCREYEQPAFNNVEPRFQAAVQLQARLTEGAAEAPADPDGPDESYWPPRMLDRDMLGADVQVLQAILLARGYAVGGVTGIFDNRTRNAVLSFQADSGLTTDGVVGPVTWRALGVRT